MTNQTTNKNTTALVTGATGMVGSRLVLDLVNAGYHVVATYRNKKRINQFWKNIAGYTDVPHDLENRFDWIELDVASYPAVLDAIDSIDIVFHTAAHVSFDPADRETMYETNISGTANLVNACLEKHRPRFIHVSSIAALGKAKNGEAVTEETAWIPEQKHSAYSFSKFHSEMEVWRGMNEGLQSVIVNPSVILGPGDWKQGSASFFRNIHDGLAFYPNGSTGFIDVRDVTKAMLLLAKPENFAKTTQNRYLLNAENLTYKDFFGKVATSLKAIPPRIPTSNFMLSVAWRLAWIYGKISGKKVSITRDSVSGANNVAVYSGEKIVRDFGFSYRSIDESISEIATIFQREN